MFSSFFFWCYDSAIFRYEIYKSFTIDLGKLSFALEERLLLKLLYFMGYSPTTAEKESELLDETKVSSYFLEVKKLIFAQASGKDLTVFDL